MLTSCPDLETQEIVFLEQNKMEVKSDKNFELNADIHTVWNLLINPEKVVTRVPGTELTETIDENHLKG